MVVFNMCARARTTCVKAARSLICDTNIIDDTNVDDTNRASANIERSLSQVAPVTRLRRVSNPLYPILISAENRIKPATVNEDLEIRGGEANSIHARPLENNSQGTSGNYTELAFRRSRVNTDKGN